MSQPENHNPDGPTPAERRQQRTTTRCLLHTSIGGCARSGELTVRYGPHSRPLCRGCTRPSTDQ